MLTIECRPNHSKRIVGIVVCGSLHVSPQSCEAIPPSIFLLRRYLSSGGG